MHRILAILMSIVLFSPAMALQGGNLDTSRAASAPEGDQKRGPVQFRADVDQVVVYASVYDREGQMVSGLNLEDFEIYEDRVQQTVSHFGRDDVPSTIGLVMDTSGSMRDKWDMVHEATNLFLTLNNPDNEMFLIRFDHEVELEENFTRDVYDIKDALDNIIISGGTALYDAVYLAVEKARQGAEPRKALVVFTDGEDKDSYYKHEELIKKVEESEVQVHIIAFLDSDGDDGGGFFGVFRSRRNTIQDQIEQVATSSGGKALFPEKISELKEAFESIAYELRNQYRLAYTSTNPDQDGSWRRLDVVVKDAQERGLRVRARRGYYAGEPASAR